MRATVWTLSILLLAGCTVVPDVAPKQPYFKADPDLGKKAAAWEQACVTERLNKQGLLLYTSWGPAGWNKDAKGTADYWDSHDIADAPAWHGRLMAALALAWAVDKKDRNVELERLADGLLEYYKITGQEGLFGRSYMVGYTGPRLPWMEDHHARPTKFWKQEASGWWRTGLAKNHLLGAVLGCALPLHLHEQGKIAMSETVKKKMIAFMVPVVSRLAQGNYRIIGYDGKPTEFGDLRPAVVPQEYIDLVKPYVGFFGIDSDDLDNLSRPINGFNMTLVLAMLLGAAPYDPYLRDLYNTEAKAWGGGISLSLRILGHVVKRIGHALLGKPSFSDMEAFAFAAMALLVMNPSGPAVEHVKEGWTGLWGFMRFERNPMFALPYAGLVDKEIPLEDVMEDLRDFPGPKEKVAYQGKPKHTGDIYPLANRPTKSHYWKSSPFQMLLNPGAPVVNERGSKMTFSGQDYLLAYWTMRYFGIGK